MDKKEKTNFFKALSVLFVLVFSASAVSALSLIAQFDDGTTSSEIMPGKSDSYYVMAVADQGLDEMRVQGALYDLTTGEKVFLGTLFDETTIGTFFYPDAYDVTAEDYKNLPGTYLITITAEEWLTNGLNKKTSKDINLEVIGNRLPIADFVYDPSSPDTETTVTLTSKSYDTDGYIVKTEWFADSVKIGEGTTLKHVFNKAGTVSVTIKVTDNEQGTASKTQKINVRQAEPTDYPIADFVYTPLNPDTDDNVKFTSTSYDVNGGSIVKEEWDFNNDGVFEATGHIVNKVLTSPGTYKVTLRVTDNSNLQASVTKNVVVTLAPVPNKAPVADFTYMPTNPIEGDKVTFTSTSYDSDGKIVSYLWQIDNSYAGSENIMTKTFTCSGVYTVTLTVKDDDGVSASKTKQVVVGCKPNNAPVADFTYSPANPVENQEVVFTSTSYDSDGTIVSYKWFIDGSQVGTSKVMKHTFTCDGTYTVKLTVVDDDGVSASKTKQVVVGCAPVPNKAPVPDFIYTPSNPIENQKVTFTSTSYDTDGTIVSYKWYIDNVFVGSEKVMTKNFTCSGVYTVKLTVTDDDDASASKSKSVVVGCAPVENNAPVADFIYNPLKPVINEKVVFTSTSYDVDGTIISYTWFVDGVQVGHGKEMNKVFTKEGIYTVKLTVKDDDGAFDSESKQIVVGCAPNNAPVADFDYNPLKPVEKETVKFTSTSYDTDGMIVSQIWYVDGVQVSSEKVMSRTFTSGIHTVTLTVVDNDGASDSETKQIFVGCAPNIAPVADFEYAPQTIYINDMVTFTSTSYDSDGTIVSYQWTINGVASGKDTITTKKFTKTGTYTISLTVVDNDGASDTETKQIIVNELPNVGPVADFVYTPTAHLNEEQVTFTSTSYDSDGYIVSYEWSVDGSVVANSEEMVYVFANAGTYTVSLKVTDNDGASDTETKTITIAQKIICTPNAVLKMPESVTENKLVKMDGSKSTAACNNTLVSYRWQIYKKGSLISDVYTTTPYSSYTFSHGEHRVVLTVYDNEGNSDSDEKIVFAGRAKTGLVKGSEDGLFVDYFDVVGSDYGVISCEETFAITATVTNDREDDVDDLRITFSIPELGYEIESEEFDLREGRTKTVTFYGNLDMMKEEVPAGEYYAFIGASDTDTIRVKHFPLIIE